MVLIVHISGTTRYFKHLVYLFSSPSFYDIHVHFPIFHTPISSKILNDHRFQFLEKCIGAVDDSHIHVFSAINKHTFMWDRKGYLSQNCLFACNFEFDFIHSLCRWDESVADSVLWRDVVENNIKVPISRYFLGDAGFASCNALLVPHCGMCYNLKEWYQRGIGYMWFSLTFPADWSNNSWATISWTVQFSTCCTPQHHQMHLWGNKVSVVHP